MANVIQRFNTFSKKYTHSFSADLILGALLFVTALVWFSPYFSRENLGVLDWTKELFYFESLRTSLLSGKGIPLSFEYIPPSISWYPALAASNSYIGNPETIFLSPFIPLAFLPIRVFFYTYVVAHLAVAVVGVVLLKRELILHPIATYLLFMGLFLSPWLVQHIVIGYTPWLTACWLPLAVWLVLKQKPVWAGAVLAAILYEGGFHIFIWTAMGASVFVALLFAFKAKKLARSILFAGISSLVIASPRLIAITAANGHVEERKTTGSYSSLLDIWYILTDNQIDPFDFPAAYNAHGVDWYDGSHFVGTYTILLCAFTILLAWPKINKPFAAITLMSTAFFILLGWRGAWAWLVSNFHLLGVEIYPYRFLPIALVFMLILWVGALNVTLKSTKSEMSGYLWLIALIPSIAMMYERAQYFGSVTL